MGVADQDRALRGRLNPDRFRLQPDEVPERTGDLWLPGDPARPLGSSPAAHLYLTAVRRQAGPSSCLVPPLGGGQPACCGPLALGARPEPVPLDPLPQCGCARSVLCERRGHRLRCSLGLPVVRRPEGSDPRRPGLWRARVHHGQGDRSAPHRTAPEPAVLGCRAGSGVDPERRPCAAGVRPRLRTGAGVWRPAGRTPGAGSGTRRTQGAPSARPFAPVTTRPSRSRIRWSLSRVSRQRAAQ